MRLEKIVSGGQTGVDRAALDVAIELGLDHGGWCPRGRLAEDAPISERYRLRETAAPEYRIRTEQNVIDSDATLILCHGTPSGGTELTVRMALKHAKPHRVVDLDQPPATDLLRQWLEETGVRVLNVAGPRESQTPNIAAQAARFLTELLTGPA